MTINEISGAYSGIPCDKCEKQPTTRWYGLTCIRLCSKQDCYDHYDRIYKEMIEEDEDELKGYQ
jgi:pentatricopeptide repeat protein